MLSEDYFGFPIHKKNTKNRKVNRRTQFSSDRLSSHSRSNSRQQDQGIEQLKKKYQQINKKGKKKDGNKKQKRSYGSLANYQIMKMQYLHYNDEGAPNGYQQIQRRTQYRAMQALQRNQSVSPSHHEPITFQLKNNSKHLKGIIKAVIRDKNTYSQTERVLAQFKNKYSQSQESSLSSMRSHSSHRVLRKAGSSEKIKVQSHLKSISKAGMEENNPGKSNIDPNSGISYCILGMNTLRKDPLPASSNLNNKDIFKPPQELSQGASLNKISAGSLQQQIRLQTSQISINSKHHEDEQENNEFLLERGSQIKGYQEMKASNSVLKNNDLITSDYEKIKMLEKRAKQSRVRILKGEDDSLQGSISYYANNPGTQNSSFMPGSGQNRGNSDSSSISNMIYASSKLFDEKRRRNFNQQGDINNSKNSGDSFMKVYQIQKNKVNEGYEANIPQQQSFILKDTFGNTGEQKNRTFNIINPSGQYYNNGAQISPGPSRMLLGSPATPKIYNNSRIIYNQSNMSASPSAVSPIHSPHHQQSSVFHKPTMSPPPQFNSLTESSQGINSTSKKQASQINSHNRNSLEPIMPPIKQSLGMSGSINENQDLAATGRFNLAKSMRLWNSFEEQVIGEHFRKNEQDLNLKQLKQKIDLHMSTINWIADFIQDTQQFYAEGQNIQFQLCSFLLYKKFYQQRIKVVECLRGEIVSEQCFRLSDKQIGQWQLRTDSRAQRLQNYCKDLESCNNLIWNSVQQLYEQTKKYYYNNKLVNLNSLNRQQIAEIFDMLYGEIHLIIPKISDLENSKWDSFQRDQSYSIICWRSFRIMELVFLLSELQGRKSKKFQQEIQTDYFQHYVKQHFGSFQETVFYFRSY